MRSDQSVSYFYLLFKFSVQGVDREVVGAVMEALYNKVYQLTGCFKIRQDDDILMCSN